MIAAVDEFILYDDMQFTKNDWRNRNKIKTSYGLEWVSIPVGSDIKRRIRDVILPSGNWRQKHLKTFELNYSRANFYREVMAILEPIYLNFELSTLSQWNRVLIESICMYLGINTKISNSWDYELEEGKTERLVNLCQQAQAQVYISGTAAKGYLDESLFKEKMIQVEWFDYVGYQKYPQLWGDFKHEVSVLDLMFNCGLDSSRFMKYSKGD